MILFENWQGIKAMGHSASLVNYNNTIIIKYDNITDILEMKHKKIQGIDQMGCCAL